MRMRTEYHVKIVRRDEQDDYHATITRLSDSAEIFFINATKWILKLRTRRWFLDRAFEGYDKREVEEVEEFVR